MPVNVLSWSAAIKKGCEPTLYSFYFEKVPFGEYDAMLDFKIWAKKIMAINCYFTQVGTAKKFQLTVSCWYGRYKLPGCATDFAQCPVNSFYKVMVIADERKKKILFSGCFPIT
jgi:hypothetical protein